MISQPAIEKLEREAFRGPLLTLAALFLIAAGLAIIGLTVFFWVDASETSSVVYSSSLETRTSAPPTDPIARYQADFASRAEWLALLPYQGIHLDDGWHGPSPLALGRRRKAQNDRIRPYTPLTQEQGQLGQG